MPKYIGHTRQSSVQLKSEVTFIIVHLINQKLKNINPNKLIQYYKKYKYQLFRIQLGSIWSIKK